MKRVAEIIFTYLPYIILGILLGAVGRYATDYFQDKVPLTILWRWQELLGAMIGAAAPFILWWFSQKYQETRTRRADLYFLRRLLIDQINNMKEVERSVTNFIDNRLRELIDNINRNPPSAYSIDTAFFPLFSVRALDDGVHNLHTGSGYLDNKVAESYKFSKDMPIIVDDLRRQFSETVNLNREICFQKCNPPDSQKKLYIDNLSEFIRVTKRDLIEKNIPIYIRKLAHTYITLEKFIKLGKLEWRLQFDPKFRFFWFAVDFRLAMENNSANMDKYFEADVAKFLNEISSAYT